ncbi:MAG: hypothetical protein WCW13_03240 [archaeon]|jgi:hypothetical protein
MAGIKIRQVTASRFGKVRAVVKEGKSAGHNKDLRRFEIGALGLEGARQTFESEAVFQRAIKRGEAIHKSLTPKEVLSLIKRDFIAPEQFSRYAGGLVAGVKNQEFKQEFRQHLAVRATVQVNAALRRLEQAVEQYSRTGNGPEPYILRQKFLGEAYAKALKEEAENVDEYFKTRGNLEHLK